MWAFAFFVDIGLLHSKEDMLRRVSAHLLGRGGPRGSGLERWSWITCWLNHFSPLQGSASPLTAKARIRYSRIFDTIFHASSVGLIVPISVCLSLIFVVFDRNSLLHSHESEPCLEPLLCT